MSTAESILAMRAAGTSYRAIGRALGVNDSLVGQIARGAKPGRNLEQRAAALAGLVSDRGSLPAPGALPRLPEPVRRHQRVRQATRRGGSRWAVATAKDQATRSGAHGLAGMVADAAVTGRRLGLNLSVSPRLVFAKSGGKRRKVKGRAADQQVRLGDAGRGLDAESLAEFVDAHDGDVRAALADYLESTGHVQGITPEDIRGIEISSWD
jgi:hypothetical protein